MNHAYLPHPPPHPTHTHAPPHAHPHARAAGTARATPTTPPAARLPYPTPCRLTGLVVVMIHTVRLRQRHLPTLPADSAVKLTATLPTHPFTLLQDRPQPFHTTPPHLPPATHPPTVMTPYASEPTQPACPLPTPPPHPPRPYPAHHTTVRVGWSCGLSRHGCGGGTIRDGFCTAHGTAHLHRLRCTCWACSCWATVFTRQRAWWCTSVIVSAATGRLMLARKRRRWRQT